MKVKEIAEKYNIDEMSFDRFLLIKQLPYKKTFSGNVVADENVDNYVKAFREYEAVLKKKAAAVSEEKKERAAQINSFMMTTGCSFEGYAITEYVDVMFDEILVGLGFGKAIVSSFDNLFSAVAGTEATTMINKLNTIKEELKDRLIQKAVDKGANAMLGIDFESSKLGDLIMVSMTGTAVKIKKIEE